MKSENPDGSLDVAARRSVRARPLAVRVLAACAVLGVFDTGEGIVRAQPQAETWDVTQPRGKTRDIDFTTDEGTIQSLGLSPDGRSVVFDLLGHVYRVPAEGGDAECLTQASGIALNYDPRYSPDGQRIAFVSDRGGWSGLWVMNADGSQARQVFADPLTAVGQPTWTPDGAALAAVRYYLPHETPGGWSRSTQIWRFPLDGAPPRLLVGSTRSYVSSPSVSPDGRYLYYESTGVPRVVEGYFMIGDGHHVERLDLTNGGTDRVTEEARRVYYRLEPFHAAAPEISPDGRNLAFVRRVPYERMTFRNQEYAHVSGLWIRDLETGAERLLMSPVTPDHLETYVGYHLRFSPGYGWAKDGRSIVLTEGGKIHRVDVESGRVATIPFTAPVHRTISERARPTFKIEDGSFSVKALRWPATSPDGNRLLFQAVGKIWQTDLPGSTPRLLLPKADGAFQHSPAWSPDGQWIAYTTWDDERGGGVSKVAASGGEPVTLSTEPGEYLNPVWSPDGRFLVVVRGSGALRRGLALDQNVWFDLVRIPAEGGTATLVARTGSAWGQIVRPVFGPGGRLFYTEEVGSSTWQGVAESPKPHDPRIALVSVASDGTGRREHARFPWADDVAISPDGKWVAFHEAENVLLAALPARPGRDPVFLDRDGPESRIVWVTREGGQYPRWRSATELELVSGSRYLRYDVNTRRTEALDVSLKVPRQTPTGAIALTNARLLTMKNREVVERGTIVVRGSRIACVGTCDTEGVDRVIDVSGKTIVPGLMDAHHHPGWDRGIVRQHVPNQAVYLAYGITTVLEPAGEEGTFVTAELIEAGRLRGARTFTTGPNVISWGDIREIDSLKDAEEEVKRLADSGAVSIKQYLLRRREQRQWVVEAARRLGTIAVTGERMDLYYDLGMIMDGQTGVEHIFTEHPIYRDVAKFVAQSGANYTPALQASGQGRYPIEYFLSRSDLQNDPKYRNFTPWRQLAVLRNYAKRPEREYPFLFWNATVKDILQEGGSVSVGAHGREHGIGPHWEMWTFAMAISPMETLETATILPARYLGLDRDLGTIEVGKLADLVVLNSNPLDRIENTANIAYVMQSGYLYDDDTLDRVWPDPAPFGPRPWMFEP